METTTCTITAKYYQIGKINTNITLTNVPEEIAYSVAVELSLAFRDITVINDDTGELIFTLYTSSDWFKEYLTAVEAMKSTNDIIRDFNKRNNNEEE